MKYLRMRGRSMKGAILVLVVAAAAAVVFAPGCDSGSGSSSPIVRVYPWSGMTGVDPYTDIIVQFNTSLNTGVLGNVAFHVRDFSDTYATINFGTTSLINDTVLVSPDDPLDGTSTYDYLYVSGFQDSEGNTIATVNDFDYSCTTR